MTKNNNKILIVGDLHLKSQLPYNDYIDGGRDKEKQEVLDFVIENSKTCDTIVLLGDCCDSKNPSSDVIKEFTAFLERFNKKQKLYLLVGNHDLKANGTSSIDYLKEIKLKNWKIINGIEKIDDFVFCSYHTRQLLEVNTNEEGQKKLMKLLPEGKILFVHQAVSDSLTNSGQNTNVFNEIVLPKKELEKKYEKIIGGHIHAPQIIGNTLISGSVFSFEVNEIEKFIHIIDEETLEVEQIKLPVRPIYKLEDITEEKLNKLPKNSIIKAVITKKLSNAKIKELKELLDKFSGYVLLEQIPKERKKLHYNKGENILMFSVDQLLELYSKEKKVDLAKLKYGFGLIKG